MKKLLWLIIPLVFVSASWLAALNKYDIKSGIITQEIVSKVAGMEIKMTKIIYFDDFGAKECQETYTSGKLQSALICDGKQKISLSYSKKTAKKEGACESGIGVRVDINEMGTKKDIDSGAVKKVAPMVLAGQTCDVIQTTSKNGEIDLYGGWNHIMVYLKTGTKDNATEIKAVKIEPNANVPKEKFQIPAGFAVK